MPVASDLSPRPVGPLQYGLRLDTIIRLRWLVVLGQSVTLIGVHWGFGFDFPVWPALALVALTAATNLYVRFRYPRPHRLSEAASGILLAYDTLQLTALLYLTGGVDNPFFAFYLAPLLISATALSPRTTFLIGVLMMGTVTFLSFLSLPLPWYSNNTIAFPPLYRGSEWIAMFVQVAFIGLYTWKIADENRQIADALAATELVLEREQHLSALDGLAAAAAHELGTPLATIALVSREIERGMPANASYADDIRLLRQQTERCRAILARITSLQSGDAPYDRMPLSQLIDEVVAPHRPFGTEIAVRLPPDRSAEPVITRNPGILYGLGNLIENAVDFASKKVTVAANWNADQIEILITDDGPGFAAGIIDRIGEPYVSVRRSKADGPGGLGLGIFIAKTLLERTGAALTISNRPYPESGAAVLVRWPYEKFKLDVPPQEDEIRSAIQNTRAASIATKEAAE
ncbi:MAG TPA: ActS/PrrB/RegB family redox-sensitive histidine kinase [Xanthobacteraceae bacterium]|nr:ActS/PrrB/RegB family redox-sensitive histidine kinase [Xanthobacteraceae bacterium]